MASPPPLPSCPHCGAQTQGGAGHCVSCGRPVGVPTGMPVGPPPMGPPPVAPPPPVGAPSPVGPPPPPGYAPAPAGPSPLGVFLGRAFRGDWASAVKAAAWPVGLLLALAVALSIPAYGQDSDDVVVGWSDRLRIALAALLQAFGGGFGIRAAGGGDPYGTGSPYDGYGRGSSYDAQAGAELTLVPLTVTLLWIGALYLGARGLRRRGAGVDAAVRVALPAGGAVLLLGLFGRPEIAGVAVETSPVVAALVALLLAVVVTVGVLQRDDLAQWLSARPAAYTAVRALGTAVRALGVLVGVAALIGFIAYANVDEVDGSALLVALPILPNLGVAVLGLCWGVPLEYDLQGRLGFFGSGRETGTLGLPELADLWGGWAVTGMIAAGVAAALTLGVQAARRHPDTGGRILSGALFLGLFLLLAGVSGIAWRMAGGGGSRALYGVVRGFFEVTPSVADALLFGLLWVGAGVAVGPYLLRLVGRGGTAAPGAAGPGAVGAPGVADPGVAGPGAPGVAGAVPPQGYPPQPGAHPSAHPGAPTGGTPYPPPHQAPPQGPTPGA